jgi:hypothetical protein
MCPATGLPGISTFARHLTTDLDAVTAGLTLQWSSGPVEGNVNPNQNAQTANVRSGQLRPTQETSTPRMTRSWDRLDSLKVGQNLELTDITNPAWQLVAERGAG